MDAVWQAALHLPGAASATFLHSDCGAGGTQGDVDTLLSASLRSCAHLLSAKHLAKVACPLAGLPIHLQDSPRGDRWHGCLVLQTDGKGCSSLTVAFAKWALQALASSSRMRRGTRAARAVDIRATSSRETGALMTKPASARLQRHTVTRVCSTCGQHTGRGCLPLVCSLQQSMAGNSYNHMRCWTDHDADAAALPAQTLHHSMLGVPCQEQASQGGPSCFARGAAASSRPRAGDSSWTWLKLLKGHSSTPGSRSR